MTHLNLNRQRPVYSTLCLSIGLSFLLMLFAAGRSQAACGLFPYITFSDSCTVFNFNGTNIHDTSTGPAPSPACLTYSWTFGDGTTGTGASVSHTYASAGTYTVCLIISNTCSGCTDTTCRTVTTICPTPCGHMPSGWAQVDSCSKISFNGDRASHPRTGPYSDPCLKYSWNFGDGKTATGKNIQHKYTSNGTYTVCMRVQDTCRGCDTTICKTLTISCISPCSGLPTGWTSYDSCTTYSFEGNRPVDSTGTPYTDPCLKYSWNFGDGSTASGRLTNHTYSSTGTYIVSMRVQDTCKGCDSTFYKTINVSCGSPCALPDSWTQTDSCGNYDFTGETDTMAGCPFYAWDFGDSTYAYGQVVKHTYTKTGTYVVCMGVRDTCSGCDTIVCKTIVVSCITPSASIKGIEKGVTHTSVYPNPASGSFMLLSPGETSYKIVDAYGRIVVSGHFTDKVALSGDGLANGVYLVQLRSGEQSTATKLIISK